MARVNSWIGSAVERLEDLRFVRGLGQYVDDLTLPGMVRAAILRSRVPHGRISRLDTSATMNMKGVLGVVTAADLGSTPRIPIRMEGRGELARFVQPVLAYEKVRYVGEPLALVIAETLDHAEDALERIAVEIESAPPVLDARIASQDGNYLFEEHATNLAFTMNGAMGDAKGAFDNADYVKTQVFRVHRHTATPMEPRGLVAQWDKVAARLTVHGACKVPFAIRALLARYFNLEETAIDVIESDVGGGFGVRGEFYPEDFLIPFAARQFGRPVKWIESRQEHLLASAHAREVEIELELACRKDGTLLGLRGRAFCDMGAYIRPNAVTAPRNIAQVISGPYRVPHIDMTVSMVMTNKTPTASYRGPGRYEADFARERLFDMAAKDLDLDPVEFRRRNLLASTEMPYELPTVSPYGSRTACDSGHYQDALERCLVEIEWSRIHKLAGKCIDGKHHGVGVGCYIEGGGSGPRENARLKVESDGRVSVFVGSSALGQGLETAFAQIAADSLEIGIDRIKAVFHGSTHFVTEGFGSYASRSVVMGGSAIVSAAQNLRGAIRSLAAQRFGCQPDEVALDGLDATGPENQRLRVQDLATDGISAAGQFASSERTYSYGTHAAHVTVDTETGIVDVLNYVAVEDVGRIVNPNTLHGQARGAIIQGLGATLLEQLAYDSDGQLVSGSFMDYALPNAAAFPRVGVVATEKWPSPHNPLGVKGAGEGGIIPVAGVIGNAIASALSSFEIEPCDLPLSLERTWKLIRDSRRSDAPIRH